MMIGVGTRRKIWGSTMDNLKTYLAPLARLLMSSLFIWAGVGKLMDPGATAKYFASVNVPIPEVAVWVVLIVELVAGIALLVGFKARWAGAVLAIFCLITAFGVHLVGAMAIQVHDNETFFAHLAQMQHFYKNLVMAGGLLYVVVFGAGGLSVDGEKG
jgi:putative oxidoreductase